MKRMYPFLLLCLAIMNSQAQTDSTSQSENSTEQKKLQIKLSISYNSNLNYYGRTDSLRSSAVFPMLEFWATPRLYINTTPIFIYNKMQAFNYAGTVLTAGYQKMNENWLSHLYVTKTFYKHEAQVVQSALEAQAGGSFTYLNNFLNITAGGDAKLSDEIDLGATAGLDHIFRKEGNNSVWVFDPSVYVYAGTQRFTATYNKKKNNLPFLPPTTEQVTEQRQKFSILAYEFSAPLIYTKNKVQFMASPSYILPQNLIIASESQAPSEKGENMFYVTLTAKYSF